MSLLTVLLDSNAFDVLAHDEATRDRVAAAVAGARLELLVTPYQADELARIPDPVKRERLQSLSTKVELPLAVWDDASWGEAAWGGEDDAAAFESVRTESGNHYVDAQTLAVAVRRQCILVTADGRLRRRAREAGVAILTPAELLASID